MDTTSDSQLLSSQEEERIARAYRATGDRRLEERLIRSQMRLVLHLARRLRPREQDFDDVVQEGLVGLVTAVRKFDPDRGIRLSTWAGLWVRAYQLRFLVANYRLVRLGESPIERRLFFHLRRARARLEAAGAPADTESLAAELRIKPKHVERMTTRLRAGEISLESPVDDERTMVDLLAADEPSPADAIAAAELEAIVADEVRRFQRGLDVRDRAVFEQRWLTEPQPSLTEVGSQVGLGRERTRQIEADLLGRLRAGVTRRLAAA
jgi:RNA polymerase sigma-32 factor